MGSPSPDRRRSPAGWGLLEVLVGLAVVGVAVSAAAPAWIGWRDRQRLLAAAWIVTDTVAEARIRAVTDGRSRGVWFLQRDGADGWLVARDGDGDGVRRADLESGVDAVVRAFVAWERVAAGVKPGSGSVRTGPGGSRVPDDGIAVPGDLLSTSAAGTGSSGTVYLEGGGGLVAAVRWYGVTGRESVWIHEPRTGEWRRIR